MSCSSASRQILGLRSSRQTKQHQHVDVCWHRAAASFLHSWDIAAHCSSQGRCSGRRSKLAAGFSVWRSYWPWLDYSSAHSAVARGTDTHYTRKSKICAYRYGWKTVWFYHVYLAVNGSSAAGLRGATSSLIPTFNACHEAADHIQTQIQPTGFMVFQTWVSACINSWMFGRSHCLFFTYLHLKNWLTAFTTVSLTERDGVPSILSGRLKRVSNKQQPTKMTQRFQLYFCK